MRGSDWVAIMAQLFLHLTREHATLPINTQVIPVGGQMSFP